MLKKKVVAPPKKVIDSFVDPKPVVKAPPVPEIARPKADFCECGRPVQPGSHQCYSCAHRA